MAEIRDGAFVKWYEGRDDRGREKLLEEYDFLTSLPRSVAEHFAKPISLTHFHNPRRIELRIEWIPGTTLTKGIIAEEFDAERAAELFGTAMRVLSRSVFPARKGRMSGHNVWETYHARRLTRAVSKLSEYPEIARVLDSRTLIVGGLRCPGPRAAAKWLAERHAEVWSYDSCAIVLGHGDFQPDNVMVADDGRILLVDPRGDLLVPPEYDYAKALKAARTPYDAIHYLNPDLRTAERIDGVAVEFALSRTWEDQYDALHEVVLGWLPECAEAQRISIPEFVSAVAGAELAHYLSFAYYHAGRGEIGRRRAICYLAVASLLAHALMTARRPLTLDHLATRINLDGGK